MKASTPHVVLLVEDNSDDLIIIERAFEKSGFSSCLRVVPDAESAMAYVTGGGPLPTLVLLDMNLPGRSGLEFIEWFRRRPGCADTPVIAVTGIADYSLVKKAFAAGLNSYIVKPLDYRELESAVETVLRYWLVLNSRPT